MKQISNSTKNELKQLFTAWTSTSKFSPVSPILDEEGEFEFRVEVLTKLAAQIGLDIVEIEVRESEVEVFISPKTDMMKKPANLTFNIGFVTDSNNQN